MIKKFDYLPFANCNLTDPFFKSLKDDYPEFPQWYAKKIENKEKAFVYKDESGIRAFLYLKKEDEPIELKGGMLPSKKRLKIGTLKLDDRVRGLRLGEGIIGIALWKWQEMDVDEIYVTIFPKHEVLISLIEKFGFKKVGINNRGENIYLKSKNDLDLSDPFKPFPYINPNFTKAGYIPIYDKYHDTLFPYSELFNTKQEVQEIAAANGITKVFIGAPSSKLHHKIGEPVLIYRIHTGSQPKQYKSVVTSFCTITNLIVIKQSKRELLDFEDYLKLAGNKTVFSLKELKDLYYKKENLVIIELIYNGFFGKGKNITYKTLKDSGLFEDYPYNVQLSKEDFISIIRMGGKDEKNVIAYSS